MNWNATLGDFDETAMVDCNGIDYLTDANKETTGLTSKLTSTGGNRVAYCPAAGSI